MNEHLINIRDAAHFLGVGERKIKELVDTGKLPAYKIGGTFLRFKRSQLDAARAFLYRKDDTGASATKAEVAYSRFDGLRDFLYFNDFYILSIIIILIAVVLMSAT